MSDLSEFKAPFITNAEIHARADEFREKYWGGKDLPFEIEEVIEFDLGISIIPLTDLQKRYEMDAFISADLKTITIDNDCYNHVSRNRVRYSLSHEIGHFVLHEYIYREHFNFKDIAEWFETLNSLPDTEYNKIEYQAYEFAGRLLVPREKLLEEINGLKDSIKKFLDTFPTKPTKPTKPKPDMVGEDKERKDYLTNYIAELINTPFGVSPIVIKTRLHREGIDLYSL
jgi:Zn-dependent peptidase ImmA (M78 family)